MRTLTEGKACVRIETGKISKQLPVFYNPVMKTNRDLSILVLRALKKPKMQIALPLAASGIRGVRILKELPASLVKRVCFNDYSGEAVKQIKKHLKLNGVLKKTEVSQQDANLFLMQEKGFDYIDIDPFGSPNPFLDSAIRRLARGGILGVTATDTSNLAATYPKACRRNYWAEPLDTPLRHEMGVRILIRKVQLIGAQFDKALTPIFSYSKDHYYKIFFSCEKGSKKADALIDQHGTYESAGPLWIGKLWDPTLTKNIASLNEDEEFQEFLDIIASESLISQVGYYDMHALCKQLKKSVTRNRDDLISLIRKKRYKASRTHFSPVGIRTTMPLGMFKRLL